MFYRAARDPKGARYFSREILSLLISGSLLSSDQSQTKLRTALGHTRMVALTSALSRCALPYAYAPMRRAILFEIDRLLRERSEPEISKLSKHKV